MQLLDLIKESKYAVVFTGAGISTESGVPQFRGNEGLWKKYTPEIYGTLPGLISQFLIFPSKVVNFIYEFISTILNAKPNISHICLAKFEEKGYIKSLITQNIDNLHQKAGSKNVIELHGNIYRWICEKCKKKEFYDEKRLLEFIEGLKKQKGRKNIISYFIDFTKCECGGRKRPDIVFFGENLPEGEYKRGVEQSEKADLFIIIGTSGYVRPACELPYIAKRNGAKILEINILPCFKDIDDFVFNLPASKVFESIIEKI